MVIIYVIKYLIKTLLIMLDDVRLILSCLYRKYKANRIMWNKDWKQEDKTSLASHINPPVLLVIVHFSTF